LAAGTVVCRAVEVRPLIVVGGEPGAYPAVRLLLARCLDMRRKYLVRRENTESFAPIALAAHLITSNYVKGESCQLPRC
jgi:hypothetical protein